MLRPHHRQFRQGRRLYGGFLLIGVLVLFVLQYRWMKETQRSEGRKMAANSVAVQLANWMLDQKGLTPEGVEEPVVGNPQQIVCFNCRGSGEIYEEDGRMEYCPICQGVGIRLVRPLHAEDRLCPACGGMGRLEGPDGHSVETCPRCQGRGLIQTRPREERERLGAPE